MGTIIGFEKINDTDVLNMDKRAEMHPTFKGSITDLLGVRTAERIQPGPLCFLLPVLLLLLEKYQAL
jgi:hypothetical protein